MATSRFYLLLSLFSSNMLWCGQAQRAQRLALTTAIPRINISSVKKPTLEAIAEADNEEQAAKERLSREVEELSEQFSAIFYQTIDQHACFGRPIPLSSYQELLAPFTTTILATYNSKQLATFFRNQLEQQDNINDWFFSKLLAYNKRVMEHFLVEEPAEGEIKNSVQEQKICYEQQLTAQPEAVTITDAGILIIKTPDKRLTVTSMHPSAHKGKVAYEITKVDSFLVTPDGATLIISTNQALDLYTLTTHTLRKSYKNMIPERISNDGQLLFCVTPNRTILIEIDLSNGSVRTFPVKQSIAFVFPHSTAMTCSCASIDTSTTKAKNGNMLRFSLITIEQTDSAAKPTITNTVYERTFQQPTPTFKLNYDGKTSLAVYGEKIVYDSLTKQFPALSFTRKVPVATFDTSPDCHYLIAKDTEHSVTIYNLNYGTCVATIPGIATYFINATNSDFFTVSTAGEIVQYQLRSAVKRTKFVQTPPKSNTPKANAQVKPIRLIGLHTSPGNRYLVACTSDPFTNTSVINVWSLARA